MKFYNIYYNAEKLNRKPLNTKELNSVLSRQTIKHRVKDGFENIDTKKIHVVKCTIV